MKIRESNKIKNQKATNENTSLENIIESFGVGNTPSNVESQ